VTNLSKKLAPPLVTLLSSEPEVQYVALRNINLIIQVTHFENRKVFDLVSLSNYSTECPKHLKLRCVYCMW